MPGQTDGNVFTSKLFLSIGSIKLNIFTQTSSSSLIINIGYVFSGVFDRRIKYPVYVVCVITNLAENNAITDKTSDAKYVMYTWKSLSYVLTFTADNLFKNLPTNLSSSFHFLFRVINGSIWWTNSADTVVLVVITFHVHVFKFITLSVSVMIKGLRSRRPRPCVKISLILSRTSVYLYNFNCHSTIIDPCNTLCFQHYIWVAGLGKTYWMALLLKIIPWQLTVMYFIYDLI